MVTDFTNSTQLNSTHAAATASAPAPRGSYLRASSRASDAEVRGRNALTTRWLLPPYPQNNRARGSYTVHCGPQPAQEPRPAQGHRAARWRDELRERAEQVGDVVDRFGARARRAFGEDVQAVGDAVVVRAAQRAVPAAYAGGLSARSVRRAPPLDRASEVPPVPQSSSAPSP